MSKEMAKDLAWGAVLWVLILSAFVAIPRVYGDNPLPADHRVAALEESTQG